MMQIPPIPASVLCAIFLFLLSSLTALGHGGKADQHSKKRGVDEHLQTDFGFPSFRKLNQELQIAYMSFDNKRNLALAEYARSTAAGSNSHIVGSWSPVFDLPLVPIHVMVLTNGKVLMWDSVGDNPAESYPVHNFTRASIWDPLSNIVTNVNNDQTGYNVFCAGFSHLPDGTPFLAGGNINSNLDGTETIHFFDQISNTWSLGPFMTQGGRWYPSVTPMASGEMLITSGDVHTPEVFTLAGTLRTLSNATHVMPLYPWLQAAPDGRAFYFGPDNNMRYLNVEGTGSWQAMGPRDGINRTYGSFAMYDVGKIVASGGAGGGGNPSSKKTVMIDIRDPNVPPIVTIPSDMSFRRRQHNLTVLPDGTVLATGGNSSGADLIDMNSNVYTSELWDPANQTWTSISSSSKIRQYHSAAILLPDGRVFTGGGGICGDCASLGYLEKNMEIFTPPYLFKKDGSGELAPRPLVTSAPPTVAYDESFFVETPDAAGITKAVMMRVSSVTHSIDFEQRRIPLKLAQTPGGLTLRAPANSNIAPPGYYMLFLLNADGVPSEAKMIRVEYGVDLGAPIIVASSGSNHTASLSWIPVFGATNYVLKYGTTPGNYTNTVNTGNVTTLSLTELPYWRYYFAVSAENASESGGNSEEVVVVTSLAPTASPVTISGRVMTPSGVGIRNVLVSLQSGEGEPTKTVLTNSFGYYRFVSLPGGRGYALTVQSKRHRFAQPSLFVQADENISNANFTSE